MGLKFMDDVPFHEVYVHGLVRDAEGQKMSKSKGNILDPIDVIDGIDLESLVRKRTSGMMQPQLAERIERLTRKNFPDGIPAYGTDALRLNFAAMATTGRDIRLDSGRIEGYRNFCNKLWNAARYVLMNTEGQDNGLSTGPCQHTQADRWIESRLQQVIAATTDALNNYRLDHAAQAIYEFTWNEYCDWYLELTKPVLQWDDPALQRGTRKTLLNILEQLLRLAHPIIPFITEEIWQRIAPLAGIQDETIMLQPFPEADAGKIDKAAIADIEWVMNFVLGIRRIRGEMNIAPGKPLSVILQHASASDREYLEHNRQYLYRLGRLETISILGDNQHPPEAAIALLGEMKILIPLAGLIDKQAELERLDKEIKKIQQQLPRIEGKLNNPAFTEKAPKEVVAKEAEKLAKLKSSLQQLQQQQEKIRTL